MLRCSMVALVTLIYVNLANPIPLHSSDKGVLFSGKHITMKLMKNKPWMWKLQHDVKPEFQSVN